jgi:predicted ATPase/class 3 adenylate cyclase
VETFAFLFTDIEGSTALLRRLGDGLYAQVLADHHALIRSGLAAHGGREVDTQGDAFFAVFSLSSACVDAAAQMQRALQAHRWPGGEHVRVRMGVHAGEAAQTAAGLMGLDVHRAARVAAVGYGGQVLVSETAAALVRGGLAPGLSLADLGVHRLKDLGRPERIFQLQVAGLQAGFPPLRSLGSPALPNNLPAQLATFIGRDRELADVRALVRSCRVVTLTGAGGCGKTRLGLQAAAELLDGSGDGVWLAELAAVSSEEEVPSAIAAALGIRGQPGKSALEGLADALALQDVLIVVDNCEHLIGACAKTAEAIVRRCPRVHLLATSREPLGIAGETIYRVPSLSLPGPGDAAGESCDAVALLLERAREQGVSLPVDEETGPLLVSVCRRLDGLPLAIELAAARLRSLPLRALRDRLDQRFHLLTGGSRTALPRQQTLRATGEWSDSLLTGAEQALLRLLSVFAGNFDLDAVEAVGGTAGMEVSDVAGLVGSLVDESLVMAEPAGQTPRYRLLETIRHYAAERLAEAGGQAAAAQGHCTYFLGLAEAAAPLLTGPEQGPWFARLDADHANLRHAAGYAATDPDATAQVLRFGVALHRYWLARSREREALALLLPALERPGARADPALFAAALITVTAVSVFVDLAPARQAGKQAVGLARELHDDRLLIFALSALSAAYCFLGEADPALVTGQEAVERARQLGDDILLGESLMSYLLAVQSGDLTEPDQFGQLLAEATACTGRSGDQLIHYALHNNAGNHALIAGDIPAARAHLEQAARAARATGMETAALTDNLAWVRREEGDLDGALSLFKTSLRINRRNGEPPGIGYAILGLACLASDRGDWDQAAALHGIAQSFLDRSGQPWQDPEARYRHDSLTQLRAHLGGEPFDRAYRSGMTLPADQALQSALGQPPQPGPPVTT